MIPLSFLPILAAGLVPSIVGSLWYHPRVFGARWMSLKHITPDMAERSSRLSLQSSAVLILLGVIASLVLSRILIGLNVETVSGACVTAASLWLAFIVPGTINRVLWDHISFQMYAIETGQWLVSLILMSIMLLY